MTYRLLRFHPPQMEFCAIQESSSSSDGIHSSVFHNMMCSHDSSYDAIEYVPSALAMTAVAAGRVKAGREPVA